MIDRVGIRSSPHLIPDWWPGAGADPMNQPMNEPMNWVCGAS
jgi:hypothetical protein